MDEKDPIQNLLTELRRGSLTMAAMGCLRTPHYGYALLQTLQEVGVAIDANTLYPLLRRLESQGFLSSDWDTTESRPRKYYTVSEAGRDALSQLVSEWEHMQRSMTRIYEEVLQNGKLD